MKAKTIRETLNETGAGYAVWGGGMGKGFGNPSIGGKAYGRGFGFGAGNNSGGPNSMYTYSIVPLNTTLEPPVSPVMQAQVIHVGSIIKGKVLGKKKHIISQVLKVEADQENNIKYYLVLDPKTSTKVKIDPTSAFIWEPEPEIPGSFGSSIASTPTVESYKGINFERGLDPKRSLDVGKFRKGVGEEIENGLIEEFKTYLDEYGLSIKRSVVFYQRYQNQYKNSEGVDKIIDLPPRIFLQVESSLDSAERNELKKGVSDWILKNTDFKILKYQKESDNKRYGLSYWITLG